MTVAIVVLLGLILVVAALQLYVWATLLGHVNRAAAAAADVIETGAAVAARFRGPSTADVIRAVGEDFAEEVRRAR
jgi:hypothetical protein